MTLPELLKAPEIISAKDATVIESLEIEMSPFVSVDVSNTAALSQKIVHTHSNISTPTPLPFLLSSRASPLFNQGKRDFRLSRDSQSRLELFL